MKQHPFTLLFFLLISTQVFSQQWVWAKEIYGSCFGIDEDTQGNIYILSTSLTSPTVAALSCSNDTGTVIWKKDLPGYATGFKIGTHCLYVSGRFKGLITIDTLSLNDTTKRFNGYL